VTSSCVRSIRGNVHRAYGDLRSPRMACGSGLDKTCTRVAAKYGDRDRTGDERASEGAEERPCAGPEGQQLRAAEERRAGVEAEPQDGERE
jgi:hypothetical protein